MVFVLLYFFFWYVLGPLLVLYLLFFPAFRSFLINFTIFPIIQRMIIDPYYKEHPEEDLDKRHDLNLEIEPVEKADGEESAEPQEDPDVIFKDVGKEEVPAAVIPKQYSRDDMRKGRRLERTSRDDSDDDGTI